MFLKVEEDVDAHSNWAGCRGLQSRILLSVQGEDDLCSMLKVLNQGIDVDEMVPDEEHKFQEG